MPQTPTWTYWHAVGQVVAHLGTRRFRLRLAWAKTGQPKEAILTLHPAAPPPLPPLGSWIMVFGWKGVLVVICEEWAPVPKDGLARLGVETAVPTPNGRAEARGVTPPG